MNAHTRTCHSNRITTDKDVTNTFTAPLVKPSARESYPLFPVDKYALESDENAGTRRYEFFNGAVISATPKIELPNISEVRRPDEDALMHTNQI